MMDGITRTGARTPGVGGAFHRVEVQYIASTDPTLGGSTLKHEGRRQTGRRTVYAGSRLKLTAVPGRPRLICQRKPALRHDRGDDENGSIIRSPQRAIVLPDSKRLMRRSKFCTSATEMLQGPGQLLGAARLWIDQATEGRWLAHARQRARSAI